MATAYANDRAHVFHSWSAQGALDPAVIVGAQGSRMWDDKGNTYLDFSCQLVNVNIGHQHPRMVEAIKQQADRLCTVAPSMANDMRSEAARLITERAPGDLDKVFFTNGGAEAIENAMRLAKGHTGRLKVLSMYRSYHGATMGSITVTGEPRRLGQRARACRGRSSSSGPTCTARSSGRPPSRRSASGRSPICVPSCAREGGERIAAIVLETVVGTNGILVPPDGYLAGVRAICDEFGIMMICDEVMAGFGRCGEWFAVNHWGVTPDLIAFAKGVNSGYVPLGGVVISPPIAETFRERVFQGGLTYSGHPLACATAVASINIFEEEGIIDHARMLGAELIGPRLARDGRSAQGRRRGPRAGRVLGDRDRGDRESRRPVDAATMGRLATFCKQNGVWPFIAANRIHVVPPCNIALDDAHAGLDVIDQALALLD